MNNPNLPVLGPEMFPTQSPDPMSQAAGAPSPTSSLLPSLAETLRGQMLEGQEVFQQALLKAGGAATWLRSRCPRSFALVTDMTSGGATEDALARIVSSETEAFWRGIEVRLAECERCTPEGGACEKIAYRHDPGKVVHLHMATEQVSVTETQCNIYDHFKISLRLEHCGVPRRLSRSQLNLIESTPRPHVVRAFDAFVDAGKGKDAPMGFSLLMEGPRAREYGAALLRSAVRNFQNAEIRSVDAGSLLRASKEAMTTKQSSPVTALVEVDVLLIDAVTADLLKSDYSSKELRWLYGRRHDRELSTLLTCTSAGVNLVKEAFPGVSVLRV